MGSIKRQENFRWRNIMEVAERPSPSQDDLVEVYTGTEKQPWPRQRWEEHQQEQDEITKKDLARRKRQFFIDRAIVRRRDEEGKLWSRELKEARRRADLESLLTEIAPEEEKRQHDRDALFLKMGFTRSRLLLLSREQGIPTPQCLLRAGTPETSHRNCKECVRMLENFVFGDDSPFRAKCKIMAARLHQDPDVRDDLVQVALIALWYQALPKWKPGSAKFSTYAERLIKWRMIDHLRKESKHTHAPTHDEDCALVVDPPGEDLAGLSDLVLSIHAVRGGEELVSHVLDGEPMERWKKHRIIKRVSRALAA
jgi:RNA polymerase sigma factor (sigma-70 family)